MDTPIRLVIADDHSAYRAALRASLSPHADLEVVGEAYDGESAIEICRAQKPDILLLDLGMPGPHPRDLIRTLRESLPDLRVLVISINDSFAWVREMMGNGASGYAVKDDAPDELVPMIHAAARGETYYSRALRARYQEELDTLSG